MRIPVLPISRCSLSGMVSGGIARRVALVVFLSVLLLDAIVTVPAYFRAKERFSEAVGEQAYTLFTAAVDPALYPRIETLRQTGETLVTISKISGGTIYSGAGEERARFGTPPNLDWTQARISRQTSRFSPASGMFETFLPPEATRIPYGIVLGLDVRRDWDRVVSQIRERTLLSVLVAVLAAIAAAVAVSCWVTRPVRAMRASVDNALNDPEAAVRHLSGLPRHDELGRLALALDQLLFFTSALHDEELLPALSIIDRSPHGVLVLSEGDHLISANAAALQLFGTRSLEALRARPADGLLRFDSKPTTIVALLSGGDVIGHGEILRSDGEIPCLMAGGTLRRPDGTVSRRFMMLVDMRGLLDEVRNEVLNRQRAEREAARLSDELRRVRRAFDACLVVLELDGAEAPRSNAVNVLPDELIAAWRARLPGDGIPVPPEVVHSGLPPLLGDPGELRRLVDTALEVIRMRSAAAVPEIRIVASMDEAESALFMLSEPSKDDASGNTVAPIAADQNIAVYLAALSVLCRRQRGVLVHAAGSGDGNAIALRLRIDRITMDAAAGAESAAA